MTAWRQRASVSGLRQRWKSPSDAPSASPSAPAQNYVTLLDHTAWDAQDSLNALDSSVHGLTETEAAQRLKQYGPNLVAAHGGLSWSRCSPATAKDGIKEGWVWP